MNRILEIVRDFASKAHGNQQRKYSPQPFIVHPVRVMQTCSMFTSNVCILSAALLHDVLEDTEVTKEELQVFLNETLSSADAQRTLDIVIELTDEYTKTTYPGWNRKKRKEMEAERIEKTSPAAQTVKYADILDNCDEIVSCDPQFARVFLRECKMILKKIKKGNPELYKKVTQRVNEAMAQLKNSAAA